MKLRSLFLAAPLFAALSFAAAARAQGALYVNPVADHVGISTADPGTFSFLGKGNTGGMFYGVQFGGFYDIPLEQKRFEVGIDLRDAILHGNNALLNSFLVGPRIAGSPAGHPRLHPYVEPFIGVGSTRAPNTAIKVNKPQYGVFAGADYDLNKRVAFRIAEVGVSSLSTASGATIGANESVPSAVIISITTGLTFRLP